MTSILEENKTKTTFEKSEQDEGPSNGALSGNSQWFNSSD